MAAEPEGTAVAEAPPDAADALAVLSGGRRWALVEGDCVAAMKLLPPDSVDAVVCDPPYDLTSPSQRDGQDEDDGARSRSGGFMGLAWDATGIAFRPETWREVLRVLRPGGHLLAFGGTRRFHRMMCAIEDAGFEMRDTISAEGILRWVYGSGFPKSMDISKAVDRHLGKEPTPVGPKPGTHYASEEAKLRTAGRSQSGRTTHGLATEPATPEAACWTGWGTCLKPAWEPVVCARKPMSLSVTENVLRHGTGGLNIDACRVKGPKGDGVWGTSNEKTDPERTFNASPSKEEYRSEQNAAGRFPANLVLVHSPSCAVVGTRKASDGSEEIEEWACSVGCPIAEMDAQSGEAGAAAPVPTLDGTKQSPRGIYGAWASNVNSLERGSFYGDSGGASRFFYSAKASPSERHFYCRACADAFPPEQEDYHAAHRYRCEDCGKGLPKPDAKGHAGHRIGANLVFHPTVKPEAVMSWLCKLSTPPNGVVLDPFCGSGTTGVVATRSGFRFIGIDQSSEYAVIARRRIEGDSPLFNLGGGAA